MRSWWQVNLWKIVLFPALAGVVAIACSMLQGVAHRWLGFDSQGRSVDDRPPAAPARPPISPDETLSAIRADLNRAPGGQRPRLRYLALVHRNNEPAVTEVELQLTRRALADLVAALAPPDRSASVTGIDAEQLVFRLDLDALGWSAEQWRQVIVLDPYGVRHASLTEETIRRETDEPVPVVRADWFVAALTRPPLGGPGGSLGLRTRNVPETVQAIARGYAGQPIDLAVAARELGVGPDRLRRLITEEAYLRVEFGLSPLLEGKTIPRDGWESVGNLTTPFQELSNRLGLGRPICLR
jgi:hypothetical protein